MDKKAAATNVEKIRQDLAKNRAEIMRVNSEITSTGSSMAWVKEQLDQAYAALLKADNMLVYELADFNFRQNNPTPP